MTNNELTRQDHLATVSLSTLKYLRLDPADVHTRALVACAQRYRLDPMTGEVQLISTRNGPRVYISRDGMIAIAHRSGQLDGIVVDEERRSSSDDGWTCYVSVWRKDCKYPFRYGARCKDTEPQSKAGNGPEMALARAERRALKRAFAISEALDDDDREDDTQEQWEGEPEPVAAPAEPQSGALPPIDRPMVLPDDWPASPAVPRDKPDRLQGAAHRTVASWPEDKRDAFLLRHDIDDFGSIWAESAVDDALEEPF